MRNTVVKSKAIKYVIGIIGVLLILSVFPLRLWTDDITQGTKNVSYVKSEVVNYRNTFMEVFVAGESHLQSVDLYLAEGTYPDEFKVELTDGNGKHLASETVMPGEIPGYVNVLMDVDTTPGELYILKFSALRSVYFGLEDFDPNSGLIVMPYYNDVVLENKSMVIDFNYRVPIGLVKSLIIIGIILVVSGILMGLTQVIFKNRDDKLLTVETIMKWVCNPAAALLVITCLFFIFAGKVSTFLPDNAFAVVATLLLGFVMFYGINHRRDGNAIITKEYIRTHIGDFVQSLGIAYAIHGCCAYVSGLYDINHAVAERKEMIGFAIAIIAMFGFTEIVNLYNVIWIIAGIIGGACYYNNEVAKLTAVSANITEDDLFVLRANAVIVVLLGIILIRTIKCLFLKKMAKPNTVLSVVTLIYFVLIVVFRNTRWWTVALVVSFLLLFVNYGVWNKKENFLTNVVRGVVIQFIMSTGWCLLHRPYTSYGSARYTHYFHTETITATYMTMVLCIVGVMVVTKISSFVTEKKESEGVKLSLVSYLWKELVLFGIVTSYLIFTLSRTAFAATIVAFAFLFIVTSIKLKGHMAALLKTLLALIVSVVVMLPIVFEAQRTIPCLASRPRTYDIEAYSEKVMRGRQLDSTDYMLVGRLGNLFCEKILGISEDTLPAYYNEDVEYNEYRAAKRDIYYAYNGYQFKEFDISDEEWDEPMTEEQYEAYVTRFAPRDENGEIIPEFYEEDYVQESPAEVSEEPIDYTNGRLDIYKSYIEQINMTGHDTMGATLKNGEIATHAHDVYLQVAYDHGVPTAVVFVIFGITLLVMGIIFFMRNSDKYDALAMTIVVAFAVAGVVEWVFHLSHPMSFVMLLCATPLMFMNHKMSE